MAPLQLRAYTNTRDLIVGARTDRESRIKGVLEKTNCTDHYSLSS